MECLRAGTVPVILSPDRLLPLSKVFDQSQTYLSSPSAIPGPPWPDTPSPSPAFKRSDPSRESSQVFGGNSAPEQFTVVMLIFVREQVVVGWNSAQDPGHPYEQPASFLPLTWDNLFALSTHCSAPSCPLISELERNGAPAPQPYRLLLARPPAWQAWRCPGGTASACPSSSPPCSRWTTPPSTR